MMNAKALRLFLGISAIAVGMYCMHIVENINEQKHSEFKQSRLKESRVFIKRIIKNPSEAKQECFRQHFFADRSPDYRIAAIDSIVSQYGKRNLDSIANDYGSMFIYPTTGPRPLYYSEKPIIYAPE
jgi:hypothetical protein